MRIATWNIERLKHKRNLDKIVNCCENLNADVLVLTETDEQVRPNFCNGFNTPTPSDIYLPQYAAPLHYAETEHRVSIFTNYEFVRQHITFDKYTSLCVELKTERGNILIYGTIIGKLGNREKSFKTDLLAQLDDIRNLTKERQRICVVGDYNCSFYDDFYFTVDGRNAILRSFDENQISILTMNQAECIDHIAVSKHFLTADSVVVSEWNLDKSLSDHKGILAEF